MAACSPATTPAASAGDAAGRGPRGRRWALALAALSALALLVGAVGAAHLPLDSHEIRVARTATEMARRGDWIVPYGNGRPRLEKPPLSYWLAAGSHRLFGGAPGASVTAWEARFPSVMAGVGLALVAAALGTLVYGDRRAGLVAGTLVVTTGGLLKYSHSARPEMVYALFCGLQVLGMVALLRSIERGDGWPRRARLGLWMWLAAAGAFLTKGPALPLFLLFGAVACLLIRRDGRAALRVAQPATAVVVLGLTVGLWTWAVSRRMPGAFGFWQSEILGRTGGSGGWWHRLLEGYYLYATPLLVLPWLALLPGAVLAPLRRGTATRRRVRFVWAAVVVPLLLLSLSAGRHAYYMLPTLAPLCVLMGGEGLAPFDRLRADPRRRRRLARLVGL
ncbi:MAG: ArnT family glycosyltransferase, partial [Planctomycetota bacterium]